MMTATAATQLISITRRQMEVVKFIHEYRARCECSPTMQEIADGLKVSKVTIFEHAGALVKKRWLTRDHGLWARSLKLTPEAERQMTPAPMSPAFQTERLNVFRFDIKHRDDHLPRILFAGYFRTFDWPGQAVTVTIFPGTTAAFGGEYVDWIETSEMHRRNGLGREIWRGIEKYLGKPLYGDGASEAGTALCMAMEREGAEVA